MPEVRENVLIDFSVDYTELINAQEQLAQSGKIDAAGFNAVKKAITSTATDTRGLITEFKKVATTATQLGKSVEAAFGAGVQDALDEAGVSLKDFSTALTKANAPAKSLRQELKDLREALATMKAAGKDTGAEFEALRARAGKLSDAIADAGQEIKNAGSDTRQLDNVVGSISALAGGFAAVQGAAALFGDESEDLQKALLKVNGALALSTGLQQIAVATQKEGALTKLADVVATKAQSAATVIYTFVTGGATVATKLLRAAIISTGIGAIVVLLVAFVQAMRSLGDETEKSAENIRKFNEAQDAETRALEDSIVAIDKKIERQKLLNRINLTGGALKQADDEAELTRVIEARDVTYARLNKSLAERNRLEAERTAITAAQARVDAASVNSVTGKLNIDKATLELATNGVRRLGELRANLKRLNEEILKDGKAAIDLQNEVINTSLAAQGDDAQEAFAASQRLKEKQAAQRDRDAEKFAREEKERIASGLADQLAALERQLLAVEKNTQAEIDIKKKIVRAKADIELNAAKLTANQILLINERVLDEQLKLQQDFNKKLTNEQLQSQIDTNAAILAGVGITNEERLRLQIENITTTSQLEINAAEGNAAKILLIEAKKQADIRALRLAEIDSRLSDELSSNALSSAKIKAALGVLSKDYTKSREERVGAIIASQRQELRSIDIVAAANREKLNGELISQQTYNDEMAKLAKQRVAIAEDTNEQITASDLEAAEKRKQQLIAAAQLTIQLMGQVANFFANLAALATEQERQRIDEQKRQLQSLVEAGAITAKQAKIRAQQIEIAERQARQRQAQREKQAATFKALLAIPEAFLNGLATGGIYLAAIYAALAAAQAALIISRPVPKFFRGKKDSYEGRGSVAEIGSELVERNGRMFLYTKPTETYLHAKDKVYTASETRTILHNTNVNTTVAPAKQDKLDLKELARLMPKHSVNINIEKDFIKEAVNEGLMVNNYFNKRYKF